MLALPIERCTTRKKPMARITGELDPRRVPHEPYKFDLDLRVAIVRGGSAPGSTVPRIAGARPQRSPVGMEFAPLTRPWAWKRTTNGGSDPSVTHYDRFELSFTVPRATAGVD
jgi:hypothetical protein